MDFGAAFVFDDAAALDKKGSGEILSLLFFLSCWTLFSASMSFIAHRFRTKSVDDTLERASRNGREERG